MNITLISFVVLYLLGTLAIGAYAGTRVHNTSDFAVAGRSLCRQQAGVANWMTSQDRELAIGDNVDYVGRVLARVRSEHAVEGPLVFAGFSQGGAMAYRAAARYPCSGLMILAADVPPDVVQQAHVKLPPVLIGRGTRDQWYTPDKHAADVETLERLGVPVENCVFEGGHEWGAEFLDAAARFLSSRRERTAPLDTLAT